MSWISARSTTANARRFARAIEIFDDRAGAKQIALFPEDRVAPACSCAVVSIRLAGMRLRRPRQRGACWLAMLLWDPLRLDDFWRPFLPLSREGADWLNVLKTPVAYRLIDPSRRAATWAATGGNGGCIAMSSSMARWAICSARMRRSFSPIGSMLSRLASRSQGSAVPASRASAQRTGLRPTLQRREMGRGSGLREAVMFGGGLAGGRV
jgi:hypothetical protein